MLYAMLSYTVPHWGWDKMAAIFQTTFSNAFSQMKMNEFRLWFHWILFLRVQLTTFQHWFKWWLGPVPATCHYLNRWWLDYWCLGLNELTHSSWTMCKNHYEYIYCIYIWFLMCAVMSLSCVFSLILYWNGCQWFEVSIGSGNGLVP